MSALPSTTSPRKMVGGAAPFVGLDAHCPSVVREAMSGSSLLRLSAPRFRIELQAMRLRERGGALGVEMELLLAQLFYDATLPKGSGGA